MEYHKLDKLGKAASPAGQVCAQLSCGDPQTGLATAFHSGDLTTFTAILADIAPVDDTKHLSLSDDEKVMLFINKLKY